MSNITDTLNAISATYPPNFSDRLQDIAIEFDNIVDWAHINKLIINLIKTKEIVFHRPHLSNTLLPLPVRDIEQVKSAKLLGVYLTSALSMDDHINFVLHTVSQRFYLLYQLKKQGLAMSALNVIFKALVVSRIEYALPSFSGFLSRTDMDRLNAALRKARRWGITDVHITVEELIDRSDRRLFYCTRQSHHCLNPLLPPPSPASQTYNLRPRGHAYSLPTVKSTSFMKGFINRALFNFK